MKKEAIQKRTVKKTEKVLSSGFKTARDYKRSMRKQFNEIKTNATGFAGNIDSMPVEERKAIQRMMKTMDATHQRLVKWWSR